MARGLSDGEKHVVYPILHWALHRLPQLQKRAYLAKFLMPEPIPQELMSVSSFVDLGYIVSYSSEKVDFF